MPKPSGLQGFGSYLSTVLAVDTLLALAGLVFAQRLGVDAALAAPIILAFLLQAGLFFLPGFVSARERLRQTMSPGGLALAITASGLASYLIYSLPLGLFDPAHLLALIALAGFAPLIYTLFPARRQALSWQDVLVLAVLVTPMISGLTNLFREIYPSPGDPIPELHVLGKLMVISVGSASVLMLRGVGGAGYRFWPRPDEWRVGVKWYLLYLPIGIPLSLATGLVEWAPPESVDWAWTGKIAGSALGLFLATALPEELCFRGVLQNLLEPLLGKSWAAIALASLLFGAVHLSFRFFPNWRFALAAGVAGVFYGLSFREGRSVACSAVTHTLTVLTWRIAFH